MAAGVRSWGASSFLFIIIKRFFHGPEVSCLYNVNFFLLGSKAFLKNEIPSRKRKQDRETQHLQSHEADNQSFILFSADSRHLVK